MTLLIESEPSGGIETNDIHSSEHKGEKITALSLCMTVMCTEQMRLVVLGSALGKELDRF